MLASPRATRIIATKENPKISAGIVAQGADIRFNVGGVALNMLDSGFKLCNSRLHAI
jgi:hypothetical protein